MTYARDTAVPPERSRMEIERTIQRYGASAFSYGMEEGRAVVMFRKDKLVVRFTLTIPDETPFRYSDAGRNRSTLQVRTAREKEIRRLWRSLALVIKAKLEAVESGLLTFEEEFLAQIVLPDGSTFGEWASPQIEQVYEDGQMPQVMPGAQRALEAGSG